MKLSTPTRYVLYYLIIVLSIVILSGCGSGNNSANNESSDRSAALTFQLKFAQASKQATKELTNRAASEPDICNDYLIEDIVVSVHRTHDNTEVVSVERNCGAHGLTVSNVPAGENLYVVCKGYVNHQIRWQGQVNNIIVEANQTKNIGNINMNYTGNDQSSPEIISTFPAENATDVDLSISIAVIFNEPLAPSSIPDQAITVLNNDVTVPGSVSYNPGTYTISFTPATGNNFNIETTYTVKFKGQNGNNGAIIDIAGHPFNNDISWQFTTRKGDTTAPQIIATSPANGSINVEPQALIQAIFSELMNPDSFKDTVFKLSSAQGTVSGQIAYNDQTRTLILTPDAPLNAAIVYTATISTEAKDLAGNSLSEPYTWKFGTTGPPYDLMVKKIGNGSGTIISTPSGIDCGNTCQADLIAGTRVTLSATADDTSEFAGWSGEHCSDSPGPCVYTIECNATITANFVLRPTYSISASVMPLDGSGGSISPITATVIQGHNQTFEMQTNGWHHLSELIVDGSPVAPIQSYLFQNVTEGHTIQAIFSSNVSDISNNSAVEDNRPQINSNGHVVWEGYNGSDKEIYYYDGTTSTIISDKSTDNSNPQINSNGHVVWEGYNSSNKEIYYYDGTTSTIISDKSTDNIKPQINSNGHAVWTGKNGSYREVYYYNGSATSIISKNLRDIEANPQINSNGHVVWYCYNASIGGDEIHYYDGLTTTMICNWISYCDKPQINSNGHMVWSGHHQSSDREIFYCDGSTITNISKNAVGHDQYPQINSNGHVVWHSFKRISGVYINEIYYYDGSNTTIISNPDSEPGGTLGGFPQINSNGHVVWEGYNGSDKEIFLNFF